MNKKRFGLLTTLALMVVAVVPAAAHAEGAQWLSEGKLIPVGQVVNVTTSGKLTITIRESSKKTILKTTCMVSDLENISNSREFGLDEMKEIGFFGCTEKTDPCLEKTEIHVFAKPPWSSTLEFKEPSFIDEWDKVRLEVKCAIGTDYGLFEGTLTPEVGKSVLKFSTKRGSLFEPKNGYFGYVSGSDKMTGPPGDKKITAEKL